MKFWLQTVSHNRHRARGNPPGSLARKRERWFYLLISPWLVGLVLFQAGPILAAFGLSFTEWQLPQPPRFVGLFQFQELLNDPLFRRTLANTLYYALGVVPAGIAIGLGLALLVNRPNRGAALFSTVYFLPAVISGVATALLWGWIFNPQYGALNAALAAVGIRGPAWLLDEHWAMPAMITIGLWSVGTNMILYLAALRSVPTEFTEAAALDGAGAVAAFRYVTWPLISPVTFYLLVVNLIGAFQVFTPAYILTRGGPNNATLTLPLYIYMNAFAWGRMGYAAALALVLFTLVLGFTLIQFRLGERWVFYAGVEA
jgi:multiple sugar transport system permease protein